MIQWQNCILLEYELEISIIFWANVIKRTDLKILLLFIFLIVPLNLVVLRKTMTGLEYTARNSVVLAILVFVAMVE